MYQETENLLQNLGKSFVIYVEILYVIHVYRVELITFEILTAERLRLMGFDNRIIIDCFSNVVIHLYGNFLQMIDSEVRNRNPFLRKSRNLRSQFIVENTLR